MGKHLNVAKTGLVLGVVVGTIVAIIAFVHQANV